MPNLQVRPLQANRFYWDTLRIAFRKAHADNTANATTTKKITAATFLIFIE